MFDPENPVVGLCAEGMALEGTPAIARRLFEQAWGARRDAYDAAVAAHFLARHQATAEGTLTWSALAVRHAEAVPDGRAAGFLASLYLNLGDAHAALGDVAAGTVSSSRSASTDSRTGSARRVTWRRQSNGALQPTGLPRSIVFAARWHRDHAFGIVPAGCPAAELWRHMATESALGSASACPGISAKPTFIHA